MKTMEWHDMTDKPPINDTMIWGDDEKYMFYDEQTGKEFIGFGWTSLPYTYWRELTEQEKQLIKK